MTTTEKSTTEISSFPEIRRFLAGAVVLPLGFSIALIAVALFETTYLRSSQSEVLRVSDILLHVERLKVFVNDGQTDIRDYRLTGEPDLDNSVKLNEQKFRDESKEIEKLNASQADQNEKLNSVRWVFEEWKTWVDSLPPPAATAEARQKAFKAFNNTNNLFRAKAMEAFDFYLDPERAQLADRISQINALALFLVITVCILTLVLAMATSVFGRNSLLAASKIYSDALDKAERAIAKRDEFLSVASHELKTPLTALKLQLQLLDIRNRAELKDSLQLQRVSAAVALGLRQVNSLDALVNDFLDTSRIQNGKMPFDLKDVDLSEIVEDVAFRFGDLLDIANCQLKLDIAKPLFGCWDRQRLEQVAANLISNAIKYAPNSPIHVTTRKIQNIAILEVQDFGAGVPKAMQEKIFDRFEQVKNPKTVGGLGLGLYIVRSIVQGIGGQIRVESELGMGCRFIVELPIVPI
jgi:signal transduction histidine kinase